ncbi:MAG: hypothetical protein E6Q83_09250 [Thiothrix sp.]|nr:MAG: hypothetical protein E6Q83_09250 [Thiothrix sp.]
MWRLTLSLFCLSLLVACEKPASDDYFPLNQGLRWEYQVTIEHPERLDTKQLIIETLGKTTLKEEAVSIRATSDGTDYYLAQRADGIYRLAKRTLVESEPRLDSSPRMVLPLPIAQAKGKTWSTISQPYLIERVYEGMDVMTADMLQFPMTYSVLSLDEAVEVSAGRFSHCVLVEGQTDLSLYADARTGNSIVPITTREWYAPGVGLVKLEREEPLNTDVYKGGKLTLELLSFED